MYSTRIHRNTEMFEGFLCLFRFSQRGSCGSYTTGRSSLVFYHREQLGGQRFVSVLADNIHRASPFPPCGGGSLARATSRLPARTSVLRASMRGDSSILTSRPRPRPLSDHRLEIDGRRGGVGAHVANTLAPEGAASGVDARSFTRRRERANRQEVKATVVAVNLARWAVRRGSEQQRFPTPAKHRA